MSSHPVIDSQIPPANASMEIQSSDWDADGEFYLHLLAFVRFPALRPLIELPAHHQFDGMRWDRIKSPIIIMLYERLKFLPQEFDLTCSEGTSMFDMTRPISICPNVEISTFDRILRIIEGATSVADRYDLSYTGGSLGAWQAELARGSQLYHHIGFQWVQSSCPISTQMPSSYPNPHLHFEQDRYLNLKKVRSTQLPPYKLSELMEAWTYDSDFPRLLSRLSDTFIIGVDDFMECQGLDMVDFASWTSFYPVPLRMTQKEGSYGMWSWKPGTSILDFKLPYRLVGAILGVDINGSNNGMVNSLLWRGNGEADKEWTYSSHWKYPVSPEMKKRFQNFGTPLGPQEAYISFLIYQKVPGEESNEKDETAEKESNEKYETTEKESNERDETAEKESNERDETAEKESNERDETTEKESNENDETDETDDATVTSSPALLTPSWTTMSVRTEDST